MRRNDTLSLIAIYHFVMAVPFVLAMGVLLLLLVPVLFEAPVPDMFGWAFVITVGLAVAGFIAAAFVIVGIGIWRLWPWARWGAIVLALLVLPAFPVWTFIGLLIIFYLVQYGPRRAFGAL